MGRDIIQLENAVSTISQEYLLEFTFEYGISEDLHPELPGPEDTIVDFLEGKVGVYTRFFEFANFRIPISQFLFDILGYYQIHLSQLSVIGAAKYTSAPKDGMPTMNSYSAEDVTVLDTRHTPIQKQSEALLCLVGLSRRYFLRDDVYPIFLYDDDQDMDLFNLISAPNPTKVKTGTRPRAAHEVPLLTIIANRVIDMEDLVATATSSETPSVMEKSPLDFSSKDPPPMITNKGETKDQAPAVVSQEVPSAENIATTKVVREVNLEKEIATMRPPINQKHRKRDRSVVEANAPPKVLWKDHASVHPTQDTRGGKSLAAIGVGPEPPLPYIRVTEYLLRERPPRSPPKVSLLQRFEQEVRLLKKARARVARCNERIQVREEEIKRLGEEVESLKVVEAEVHGLRNQTKNLETLLEAEVDMKKATEAKNEELAKELESLRVKFSDHQLNNNKLSQQVSTLQAQVTGEERIKAAFEEFKKYEDNKVEQRCAEMDARLDKLSIDIDEELYPHMLTAITGMSEGLKYGIEHKKVGRDLADVEAYDPEANNKLVKALQDLKDLKYPMVDQLEKLKDAPMELIMAYLHLESDTGDDAPQWICDLRPSSSQLKIPIYHEKKKKCRVVCRTHGIGSTHHARSDGIPVSVPTVVPQGLAIMLTDAGTQTQRSEDEASPRLLRSKCLSPMYNLDWR
ncbi:hypothetical protein Tco_0038316 [Tanacetum coccineum]